ncbi:hypothetical protein BU26DRAFT_524559 [Trematosphaeria pertusa]|uniref:Uncharacterized protein n=1 Tax=Trematosphaeria pertusa TaxID=390896 RepID=A0A6A6HW79_9PLEO|nr:uncharacterized protein BU26DRAFT_524559 [Trematosphaeria pertusa]KAF2242445.1 hypothetical protein BU26DRAFT_524559 [Trematosphaeria pertusa]
MATTQAEATLTGLPLEMRWKIFEFAAARDTKPKKVLRYYFEKKEVKELIAKNAANNPDGVTPQVRYNDSYDEDSEMGVDHEGEENEQDDQDEDDEQDDGEDDDEEQVDDDDEDGEQDDEADNGNEEEDVDVAEDEGDDGGVPEDMDGVENEEVEVEAEAENDNGEGNIAGEENEEAAAEAAEDAESDGENDEADAEAAEDAESDIDEEMADADGDTANAAGTTTQTAPPPPPAPIVRPHGKWRHIPKFLRITRCPPPVELFLVSKQLNDEAKDWFYNVAVLKIDATGSFAHTSFFEEALGQIADAAFSPMESIRKAEVTFVWDSTWIRSESTGFAGNVFPALLMNRAEYVVKILKQAPYLKDVLIYWHDSAQDVQSEMLKNDVLEAFLNLKGDIRVEEHYIASDAKPHVKSTAGKRRIEFQNIIDNPPEYL